MASTKFNQFFVRQTVEQVRREIWKTMHMGEIISESELMSRFRLSRRLVRHVVHALTEIGFVEPVKGMGLKVASITFKNVRNSHGLRWAIDRYLIEQLKARTEKHRSVDYGPMQRAFEEMEKQARPFATGKIEISSEEARDYLESDLAFHRSLAITAGFDESLPIIDHLMTSVRLFSPSPLDCPKVVLDVLDEHKKILIALKTGRWHDYLVDTREHYLISIRRYLNVDDMFEEIAL